jgi:phage gp29-like protein
VSSERTSRAQKPSRAGVFSRMAGIMNRAVASVSMRLHVAAANLWRDHYNPLRGLTIQRAAALLEEGERGAYAELQWLYRSIEMQDATLGALIERRTSAIQRLDWDIKVRNDVPENKKAVAEKQAAALRAAYEGIGNFSAALEFLALASFRGFAHLEKVRGADGSLTELAIVDQWFWVREGLYGKWQINRDGRPGARQGEDVPLDRFVIREVSRPVNRVALIAFVRKGLSQKDWDAFIETYGIPAVFVIMPPDVPSGKEEEYLATADAVVSDARGALPHGSDIKTVDNGARGNNPFKDHLAYQDEQIILRGTGGKLTMLAESGSGTLGGNAHADTFEQIAQAEATEISEVLRKQIDAEVLTTVTPGERAWAYFELAANEETNPAAIVKDVAMLVRGGYRVDPEWIEEKTGYVLEKTDDLKTPDVREKPAITNREKKAADDRPAWMSALSQDMQPLGKALEKALQAGDYHAMREALREISEKMPDYLESALFEDALAEEFTKAYLGEEEDIRNGRWMTVKGRRFYKLDKGESRESYTKAQAPKSSAEASRRDPRKQEEIARQKEVMTQAMAAAKKGEGGVIDLATMPDATRSKVADAMGRPEIAEREITLQVEPQRLIHKQKEHGGDTEKERGQRPLTEDDIVRRLPLVLADPDTVSLSEMTGDNDAPRLVFTRKIDSKHTVIVELRESNRRGSRATPVTHYVSNRTRPMFSPDCTSLTVVRAWTEEYIP